MNLIIGDYNHPIEQTSVFPARSRFLFDVRCFIPEVLTSLHDEPYRLYIKAGCPYVEPPSFREPLPITISYEDLIENDEPSFAALGKSLLQWGKDWNLIANDGGKEWVLNIALCTLREWVNYDPVYQSDWGITALSLDTYLPEIIKAPEEVSEWHFMTESRKEYLDRIRSLALSHLEKEPILSKYEQSHIEDFIYKAPLPIIESYCDNVEKHYQSQGWLRIRKVNLPSLESHIAWTAKVQVKGIPCSKIAEEESVSESSVTRAVKKTLELLDLKPSPKLKQGRRKGSKESQNSWRRSIKRARLLK
jgi:hypothetical protein